MSRLEILEASLAKKEAKFDNMLSGHFADVKSANGQPLNDKRNGFRTLNRWERQNDALRNQNKEIEKTKEAIRREKNKIIDVENTNERIPEILVRYAAEGRIKQWRKHPNSFFVPNVERARIVWDFKGEYLGHRYLPEIPNQEQREIFLNMYNELYDKIKTGS